MTRFGFLIHCLKRVDEPREMFGVWEKPVFKTVESTEQAPQGPSHPNSGGACRITIAGRNDVVPCQTGTAEKKRLNQTGLRPQKPGGNFLTGSAPISKLQSYYEYGDSSETCEIHVGFLKDQS